MTLNMKLMEERQEGRIEGEQIGELRNIVSAIRKLRNKLDDNELMNTFDLDYPEYSAIIEMIDSNPDWTDEEIAEDILGYTE